MASTRDNSNLPASDGVSALMGTTPKGTAPVGTAMFTASEVEARTAIAATTLRQWERRYGLPNPERTPAGYRLYSFEDIACIEFLKARINEGVPVSRAAQLYTLAQQNPPAAPANTPPAGQAPGRSAGRGGPVMPTAARPRSMHGQELMLQLTEAALVGDGAKSDRALSLAYAAMAVEDVLLDVVQPALIEIGERWHQGKITAAHEHQASHYLRGKLHGLLDLAGNPRHGPVVVVACAPGEWHEIGALMLAVFARRAGLRTHYLGGNTPLRDLAQFCRDVGADALLVSASSPEVIAVVQAERELLRGAARILAFGGQGINDNPALAHDLGGEYLGHDAASSLEALLGKLGL
jgi:MerR family transcriptional regulator, light-induced transcriptional regulator